MTLPLNEVRQIEAHVSTAVQLGPEMTTAVLLLALLKQDYYETNGMKCAPPTVAELVTDLQGKEVNTTELETLRKCVRVGDASLFETVRNN
jgi:hypothetical protein